MTRTRHASTLADILEAERRALLRADFETLERLVPQKETCLNALRHAPPDANELSVLHKTFERNQALISAALDGLAMARAALDAVSALKRTKTYGPTGLQECLNGQSQTLSRKF